MMRIAGKGKGRARQALAVTQRRTPDTEKKGISGKCPSDMRFTPRSLACRQSELQSKLGHTHMRRDFDRIVPAEARRAEPVGRYTDGACDGVLGEVAECRRSDHLPDLLHGMAVGHEVFLVCHVDPVEARPG